MPAKTPPLTDALLRAWGPDPARRERPDGALPGFYARGEPSGDPTFFVRIRTAGGSRPRVTVGSYKAIGLTEARQLAREKLLALHGGRDLSAEKKAARAEAAAKRAEPTVAALLREWQDAKDSEWSARHAAEVRRIGKREIEPKLGKQPLRETVRKDWVELVAAKRKKSPAMASLLYRTISAFLGHAEAAGWIDTPLLPRKGMARLAPTPAARKRVLTDEELRAVWDAAGGLGPRSRALVRLLILTGARLGEVAGLDMREVNLDAARWSLPDARSKNGVGYTVPLCPLALAEITAAGAALRGFSGFSKLKRTLDERSGVREWRLHDLRRTMRTGLFGLGVTREVAEAAINHVGTRSGLVGTYDRHTYADEIITAIGKWQAHVAAIVASERAEGAEVIHLRHG